VKIYQKAETFIWES